MMYKLLFVLLLMCFLCNSSGYAYELNSHPRIFINKTNLPVLAERARGPLKNEYIQIKAQADRIVEQGLERMTNRWATPTGLVCCGITYLIERELGNESGKYATAIKKYWENGEVLNMEGDGFFGYHGMLYDWIYDALTTEERKMYGNELGKWLRYYTEVPEITLKAGHWEYNQTWAPAHLNTPNTRDGITPKLFVALALSGANTKHEKDSHRFLESWATRIPEECIPAFDEMGAVWSESMGHGAYGPTLVIPWAFEAWRTATGEDFFAMGTSDSYLPNTTNWAVHLTVPFANHTAWIDDNRAAPLRTFARIAPILAARYNDPVANAISDESSEKNWNSIPWGRFLFYDPAIGSSTPEKENYPLAEHFKGSGHIYMREKWDDPNATWAFFGAGPSFAGHSRDDEGHFLIAKKGYLVMRVGGTGHNDSDYYTGGSLAFNIVTIFDSEEKFRRTNPKQEDGVKNENDGGMIRHLYSWNLPVQRAKITSYHNNKNYTYAAADLTQAYRPAKTDEVTRQFFYLRGSKEFFIIFDRVDGTKPSYPKHWFLHMPTEPQVKGRETILTPGHVSSYKGNDVTATWLSDPAGEENVLSEGKARAFLTTLLPKNATITKRGGEGHDFWGHPDEPTAQYNHTRNDNRNRLPVVPWRLEVEAPAGKERVYFLHVIEVGDEKDSDKTDLSLIERKNNVGVKIDISGNPVELIFTSQGPVSASIKMGNEKEKLLDINQK